MMTVQEIKELIGVFTDSGLTEMDLDMEEFKLRLQSDHTNVIYREKAADSVAPCTDPLREKPDPSLPDETAVEVKAPLAGVYYRAASPDEAPYVEEGQFVKKGDTLGLIEAMKVMNEIPAPCDGKVTSIIAANESFIGYDETLILISPE